MATNINVSMRYSTFIPVLLEAMARTDGDVLELGAGVFSTPLLHWLCTKEQRHLLTLENDRLWFKFTSQYLRSDLHQFVYVSNWDDVKSVISKNWDVVLVDHSPSERRVEEIKLLANLAKYLVIHDSEPWKERNYHYSQIYPLFKYRYNFDLADHQTAVLSNFFPVDNFWKPTSKGMGFSIFARRAFLSTAPDVDFNFTGIRPTDGYLKRVSSIIRADQIAEKLDAKLNPQENYDQDVCIYVKPDIGPDFKFAGVRPYLDLLDGWYYIPILKANPQVGAIVCSESDYNFLKNENVPNQVVLIPQHHANYGREKRTRKDVTTVGLIGTRGALPFLPPELELMLKARGMEFLTCTQFFTRQDIVDFYKSIDIQIVWRPYKKKLANPLKIVNAASFGIPTIALDEPYFKEMGNCYIGVTNFPQFLVELDKLRNSPSLYQTYSERCLAKAENYHIDKIINLYKNL